MFGMILPALVHLMSSVQVPSIPSVEAIDLSRPVPAHPLPLEGASARSSLGTLGADSRSLTMNGCPIMPRMGEFHYSRVPESEWRRELLKVKAAGIDVVSSYVFWIHHEEIREQWDWSANKGLRKFVRLCGSIGLKVVIRGGPWVHAECRNGGLPDWVVKTTRPRTDDPAYLEAVEELFKQIAIQLQGLFWSQGGPVVGFQVENEYGGSGTYLHNLKVMAQRAGITPALFTRTGWPQLSTPVPYGDILPLYGGYPVGFWDRGFGETASLYGNEFLISPRNPRKDLPEKVPDPDEGYPYLSTEIGAGMETSYHRRIEIEPNDIGSLALVKLASGNNLQGYYMFHGGTNPDGKLSYLSESQETGSWNDVPVKSYDFAAPIGEFGQVRPQYHLLRRLHLFLEDFGAELAGMPAYFPARLPVDQSDSTTLRWSVRTDGRSGFLFVNNYQRLQRMPAKRGVQFDLKLPCGHLLLPDEPVEIAENRYFFWPFNLNLEGANLEFATAQPVCSLQSQRGVAYFFCETPGVSPEFCFDAGGLRVLSAACRVQNGVHVMKLDGIRPSLDPIATLSTRSGQRVTVYLLSQAESLRLWKGELGGKERVVLCSDNVIFDENRAEVYNEARLSGRITIIPRPESVEIAGGAVRPLTTNSNTYRYQVASESAVPVKLELVRAADPPRAVKIGSQGVAEQPSDGDFDRAATWRVTLPKNVTRMPHPILRITYRGDVARLYLDGKLIEDNFWNGGPFDLGLAQYGEALYRGNLELRILPLRRDAPVYFAPHVHAFANGQTSVCELTSAVVLPNPSLRLRVH